MSRNLARCLEDLRVVKDRDPSVKTTMEAILHPGILAIWGYRVAHELHYRGHRLSARLLTNAVRVLSGSIEIHPGAHIGRRFFIDHGAGVVIGETVEIGDDVTLFHQVTLGSVGWWHDDSSGRRHPKLDSGVVVGANATILGAVTIGAGAIVGAQALVVSDVPPRARFSGPVGVVRDISPSSALTPMPFPIW